MRTFGSPLRNIMTCRVLLVDDDAATRDVLARILCERLEAFVHTAADGNDAMRKLAERFYDVVLTDLRMPDVNGKQLMDLGKVIQPGIAVVIVSGEVDAGTRRRLLAEGAYEVLSKPVDVAYLVSTIQHAANAASLSRQVAALREALAEHIRESCIGPDASAVHLTGWPQQLGLPWLSESSGSGSH